MGSLGVEGSLAISGGSLEVADSSRASSVRTLSLSNASLTGAGNIDIKNSLTLGSYAAMSGSGSIVLESAAVGLIEASSGSEPISLAGRDLVNEGTLTFAWGTLFMSEGAQLENSGTFNDNTGAVYYAPQIQVPSGSTGAAPSILNSGTFERTTAETGTVGVSFSNQGLVEAQVGQLEFSAGGVPGEIATGFWKVSDGGSIVLANGTFVIAEEVDFSAVQVTGASVTTAPVSDPPKGYLNQQPYASGSVTVAGTGESLGLGFTGATIEVTPEGNVEWKPLCEPLTPGAGGAFSCPWNTAAGTYPDGPYLLRAQLSDGSTPPTSTPTSVLKVLVDNTPPTGSVTASSFISPVSNVSGTASDSGSGVASWQLQITPQGSADWSNACQATAPNEGDDYSCALELEPSVYPEGPYQLRAVITDNAGNVYTTPTVTTTLEDTPPSGTLTAPPTYLRGSASLAGTATDAVSGVAYWALLISPAGQSDWQVACLVTTPTSGSTYGCDLDTAQYQDGGYELQAVIENNAGNSYATAPVTTTIDNTPPVGNLTTLAPYSSGTINVHGPASDATSGVASWQLQIAPLGETSWQNACLALSAPNEGSEFGCPVDTKQYSDGAYQLRAVITDNAGITYTTSAVSTTIVNTPPGNTEAPSISGTLLSGHTLTAHVGTWTSSAAEANSYTYQWQSCNSLGISCTNITGATNSSYVLGAGDDGTSLQVVVTAENADARVPSVSQPTGEVPSPPANTTPPTISGTAQEEQTLTASTGTWSGSASISYGYQWQRCGASGSECVNISGATGQGYVLGKHDVETTVRVLVTASNVAGSATAAASPSAVVLPAAPSNTSLPTISGTAQDGQQLSASPGSWQTYGETSYSYQWESCNASGAECEAVEEASGPEYGLGVGDIGTTLRVTVTATNPGGSTQASSEPSMEIQPEPPGELEAPSISGTPDVHQVLYADPGAWAGTDGQLSYQWESCSASGSECAPIEGATSPEYDLAEGDLATTLRVRIGAPSASAALTDVSRPTPVIGAAGALVNTTAPIISGSLRPGQTLTAEPGNWSEGAGLSYTYQWESCDQLGSQCEAIAGATTPSYLLEPTVAGNSLRVIVTASDGHESRSQASPVTQPIATTSAPVNVEPPHISGTALQGHALTAVAGRWEGKGSLTYAYQWERCHEVGECAAIEGATTSTDTPGAQDVQFALLVLVSATNYSGSTTGVSDATSTIEPESLVDFSRPQISGTDQQGATLSASSGIWSGSGPLSYAYQWESCNQAGAECASIQGADEPEYVIGRGDLGSTLRVKATVANPLGSADAFSATTVSIPGGEVSVERAVEVAEQTDPALLSPSTTASLEEQTVSPALSDGEEGISSTGTLTSSTISKETSGEFAVNTSAGELSLTPLDTLAGADATPTIVNGAVALVANAWPATDMLIRPDALGTTTVLQLRSREAPTLFSWEADLGPDQQLQQLSDGSVAVINAPEPQTEPTEPSSNPQPSGEIAGEHQPVSSAEEAERKEQEEHIGEEVALPTLPTAPQVTTTPGEARPGQLEPQQTQSEYEAAMSALEAAEAQTAGSTLMMIEAPTVKDADGNTVPASLAVSGDTITLTLHIGLSTVFPVLVDPTVVAMSNEASSKRAHSFLYGFSDEHASTFEEFDQNFKKAKAPLRVTTARRFVPYDTETPGGNEEERKELEKWVPAVEHEGLQPYVTLKSDKQAKECQNIRKLSNTMPPSVKEEIKKQIRGCEVPSRGKYEADVAKLMKQYPGVKLWGAWNEPDLPGDPLYKLPKTAAQFWEGAQSVASRLHCGCKIVAGEFAEFNHYDSAEYLPPYAKEILARKDCKKCSPSVPVVWGLHDYHDVVYRDDLSMAETFAHYKWSRRLGNRRIWIGEAGVELQNQGEATPLEGEPGLQQSAALEFLNLHNASNRIDRVYYYSYKQPTERQREPREQNLHHFDSGLLEAENEKLSYDNMGRARPAYCVLVSEHAYCPPTVRTEEPITPGIGCDEPECPTTVSGSVNPNGSPTTYDFEYGPTKSYGHLTTPTPVSAGEGTSAVEGSANVLVEFQKALKEGKETGVVHFRLVASNTGGSSYGADSEVRWGAIR